MIAQALARVEGRTGDPVDVLTALGSADLAADHRLPRRGLHPRRAGGARRADVARLRRRGRGASRPGASAWWVAGHRSTEPAQAHALKSLGLEPLLDLGMRLGEGSGAVAALPVLRSGIAVLRDVALLSEILPRDRP